MGDAADALTESGVEEWALHCSGRSTTGEARERIDADQEAMYGYPGEIPDEPTLDDCDTETPCAYCKGTKGEPLKKEGERRVKKLLAVLVLSIAITGMAAVPAEPLEPPMVSIGEQSVEAVPASLTSTSIETGYAFTIAMEQTDVVNTTPATPSVPQSGALTSGCDLQRGNTLPSILDDQNIKHGGLVLTLFRRRTATSMEKYAPEVAGQLTPWRPSTA